MDYQKLKDVLPKEPCKWTIGDTETWLNFIGLEVLVPCFKQFSIDGSIILSLTEVDLKDEMMIKSNITIKKLMSWINVGMREYQDYLLNFKQNSFKNNMTLQTQSYKSQKDMTIPNSQCENKKIDKKQTIENKNDKIQLVIKQEQMEENIVHRIGTDGAKIGRHNSNNIPIVQESVSRYHSQIIYKDKNFYIRDIGSTSGTFIKLKDKIKLEENMLIEIGSYLFLIEEIDGINLRMEAIEGPQTPLTIQSEISSKISIGRKTTNKIHFPSDPHMSNNHACIFAIEDSLYLQDLQATNGTWLRLSPEGSSSLFHLLESGDSFKISSNVTFSCKLINSQKSQKSQSIPSNCMQCLNNSKNCVLLPCKHNCVCIECSQQLTECPHCNVKIMEKIKIYG